MASKVGAGASPSSAQQPDDIEQQQAVRFLRKLAKAPFIAIVFEDGDPRIYTKGIDAENTRQVQELLDVIEQGSE